MHRVLFGLSFLLFSGALAAQADDVYIGKIADEVFEHSEAYDNLRVLTKTIGPRLSGTPQAYTAEKWGMKTLRNAGADSVYLQLAQDDGTGCVHAIETLRALKAIGYKPRHTLRFVLFTDEENKERGAAKYASEAKQRNEKHIFALESDGGGFTPRAFSVKASPEQISRLNAWLPLLNPYGITEFMPIGGGTDVNPLNDAMGVAVGELMPDTQRYFDYHHADNDVFEVVNKRELELGAVTIAALIYLVDKYGL